MFKSWELFDLAYSGRWINYTVFNFLESEESLCRCINWSTRWRRIQVACEEVSQAVDSLLQQCSIHEGIQDTGFVLCKVNSLQNAIHCFTVQCILSNERITGIAGIRRLGVFLLSLICCILHQWKHKLCNLEASNLPQPTPEALTCEFQRTDEKGRPQSCCSVLNKTQTVRAQNSRWKLFGKREVSVMWLNFGESVLPAFGKSYLIFCYKNK